MYKHRERDREWERVSGERKQGKIEVYEFLQQQQQRRRRHRRQRMNAQQKTIIFSSVFFSKVGARAHRRKKPGGVCVATNQRFPYAFLWALNLIFDTAATPPSTKLHISSLEISLN